MPGRNTTLRLDSARRAYDRRYKVPAIAGTKAKLCGRCNEWFAAAPRERVCFGCSPARERVRRSTHPLTPRRSNERKNAQVKGRALSASLAREALAGIDYPELRRIRGVTLLPEPVRAEHRCPLVSVTDPVLIRSHKRAVAEGRQGCTCKEITT